MAMPLAIPSSIIFNKSLQEGELPSEWTPQVEWKVGDITPIFKKGKKNVPNNYRPVSLTSVPGKIMESLVRDAIVKHMKENGLFPEHQHGFLPGRSTTTQLLECHLEDWTKWLDNNIPNPQEMGFTVVTVAKRIGRKHPKEVVQAFMELWLACGYGVPEQIMVDNGGEFTAEEIMEFTSRMDIKVNSTAGHSPMVSVNVTML
ncbi:hypothetical protein Bbelb_186560 [Branchiostoma belcheri]|nr:hypothetical protein Bbelb_186560 [Branchiostoma belcheri]